MTNEDTNPNKGRGTATEPATIVLSDGTAVAVHDQFINTDGLLCLYVTPRQSGGIDAKVPMHSVRAIVKTMEAARLFNVENAVIDDDLQGDEDVAAPEFTQQDIENLPRLFDPNSESGVIKEGDIVTVRDEDRSNDSGPWKVKEIRGGEATLWSAWQPIRCESVDDLTVVEKAEDCTPPVSLNGGAE